jgi:hypothetical protein
VSPPGYPGGPEYPYRQLSPGGPVFPSWIPCTACRQPLKYHIDKKCPFDSTDFRPNETTIELILGEMSYADRKRQADIDSWNYSKDLNAPVKTFSYDEAVRHYFMAFEVVVDKLGEHIKFLEES